MKKSLLKTIALTSALALAFPLFSACGNRNEEQTATSLVAIDINPSISFSLDKDNKVISVHASNEDAQIMLYGEELKGLKLEVALEKIAQLSVDLGYLNEDNYGVNVNVSGTVGENDILAKVNAAFDKEAGELNVNVSADGTFSDLRTLESIKATYSSNVDIQNLTVSDYKLIAEVQSVDGTITVEEAVKMSEAELMEIVSKASEAIKPYATNAYNKAIGVAQRVYNELKGQLIDALWIVPYAKDYANILTGNRKYTVNNGALYNMYSASSRALGVAIDGIETAIEIANETEIDSATIDKIALELQLSEEQKNAFVQEVTVDGKITLASVEKYLNKWLKNLTEEERAQVASTVEQLIAEVGAFASKIDAAIAEEYKTAINKLASDLTDLIPTELKTIAGAYVTEFENLVNKLSTAATGKEPLVAIKAIKEVFDAESARLMNVMQNELTEEDLDSVNSAIALVNDTLAGYEQDFAEAMATAEAEAKAWLESKKAERTNG